METHDLVRYYVPYILFTTRSCTSGLLCMREYFVYQDFIDADDFFKNAVHAQNYGRKLTKDDSNNDDRCHRISLLC